MGLTRRQTLWRVELPLAVPAIMAGVAHRGRVDDRARDGGRVRLPEGARLADLPRPARGFKTEILVAGALAVALALVADALLVLAERALTPWAARRRAS